MWVFVWVKERERVLFAPLVILSFLSVFVCVRSAAANNIAGNPDFDFPLSSPCDIKRLMHQSLYEVPLLILDIQLKVFNLFCP